MSKLRKKYLLDTNILLHTPDAIFGFDDNEVLITHSVFSELDAKKNAGGEVGYGARSAAKIMESFIENGGSLTWGVSLDNGGTFRVIPDYAQELEFAKIPNGLSLSRVDMQLIKTALAHYESTQEDIIIVTNDRNFRIACSMCGQPAQPYRNERETPDDYTGYRVHETEDYQLIGKMIHGQTQQADFIDGLVENEFVNLKSGNMAVLSIYRNGMLIPIKNQSAFSVVPYNSLQSFALYALTAPVEEIPMVILRGVPGTAKTFLSLAAGLDQTYDSKRNRKYHKILISRNNITADADFGYLPGDLEDKMTPLLAPFYDNLESLIRGNGEEDNLHVQRHVEDLFETGVIEICPLAYIRGRSITNSFLIVDEAQNATRSQMRDICTRAGKGTKLIILGDPTQIDNPALDAYNTGITYAANAMKGSPLCAQITFDDKHSVRSALASEALARMDRQQHRA